MKTPKSNLFYKLKDESSASCSLDSLVRHIAQELSTVLNKHRKFLDAYWIDICSVNDPNLESEWNNYYSDCEQVYKLFETTNASAAEEIFQKLLEKKKNGVSAPYLTSSPRPI